jgi:hypothetical protein
MLFQNRQSQNPRVYQSIIIFPSKMAVDTYFAAGTYLFRWNTMESSNLAVSSSFTPIATAGNAWTCHFQVTQNHGSSPQFLEIFGIV